MTMPTLCKLCDVRRAKSVQVCGKCSAKIIKWMGKSNKNCYMWLDRSRNWEKIREVLKIK